MAKKRGEDTRERILNSAEALIMTRGFAGTSIDDILRDAELTKGAFFHYFKSKADLARALVELHAHRDLEMFERFAAEAEARSADPLEQVILALKAFEDFVGEFDAPVPGCIYAVYTYESMQFDASVRGIVADTLKQWTAIYARKFQDILDRYKPALPVTARQLAELIVSVIEGGFVLERAHGELGLTRRQAQQFRNYLELLFRANVERRRLETAAAV